MSNELLRVLHVDDQHLWRSTVSDYLTLFGCYEITSAESGEEALRFLRNSSFDVIISDYQMPEMNGIQLLEHIRKKGNTIPFILFTGLNRDELANHAKESGADFYMVKTGDPMLVFSDLNMKIIQAVERYHTVNALMGHSIQETMSLKF